MMQRIGIAGAGTMGSGIAQLALQHRCTVVLYDIDRQALDAARDRIADGLRILVERGRLSGEDRDAALAGLVLTTAVEELRQSEIVIEAIPESLPAKRALFVVLDSLCAVDTILASTTSTISITALAAANSEPRRVIGMRFFNPVHALKLVEVVPGLLTDRTVVDRTVGLARDWGKTPLETRNRPGFLVDRIGHPFFAEAIQLLAEGTAPVETIDALVKAMGFRAGPFAQMDQVGLDLTFAVSTSLHQATFGDPHFRPHPLLAEMVDAGLVGRKAGRGFYDYRPE